MSVLSLPDQAAIQFAAERLESQSFAMQVATKIGMPVDTLLRMLPSRAHASVEKAVNAALQQCLRAALSANRSSTSNMSHRRSHTAAVAITGAVGGFFGLPGLLVELPITTTVMLHSIVEIARSQGEDLTDPSSALACLEVFALGPDGRQNDAIESAYYATRTALAQITREAASYLVQKGFSKESAPALISFVGKVASRFGLEVSEKLAAELVPIAGAVGGLALNVLFSNHFQSIAEGHFIVRRLERKYGAETIRREYEQALTGHLPR